MYIDTQTKYIYAHVLNIHINYECTYMYIHKLHVHMYENMHTHLVTLFFFLVWRVSLGPVACRVNIRESHIPNTIHFTTTEIQ